jgi:hypothetical protein
VFGSPIEAGGPNLDKDLVSADGGSICIEAEGPSLDG